MKGIVVYRVPRKKSQTTEPQANNVSLHGEDFQFDDHIFQMGWNHERII